LELVTAQKSKSSNTKEPRAARARGAEPFGDTPARLIELITPAGFEGYFEDLATLFAESRSEVPDPARPVYVSCGNRHPGFT
jgi:hypothetical protein